jgi:hypothetical protein
VPDVRSAGAPPRRGPGTVLITVYCLFTLAAGARASTQLILHSSKAPVAYSLSLVAAVIYALGVLALWRVIRGATTAIARFWCLVELAGVLTVGTLSLLVPSWFPDPSVWSSYGSGYGFVPAALPLLALWWLRSVDQARVALTHA